MKIVTFNVNGVRARIDTLIEWLKETNPDVVALQEIKIQDADFPRSAFEKLGYHCYLNGQKSFNGVAILTKGEAKLSNKILPGDGDDKQSRFIEAYWTYSSRVPLAIRMCTSPTLCLAVLPLL